MIHHGDLFDVLPTLEADSIDACVTDPPYGLGFMGKEWDSPGEFVQRKSRNDKAWDHVGGNHNASNSADQARTRLVEGRKMQEWSEQWAREVFRVLKPGGYLLAFGGTRTYHRMVCAIEDAGFEIRDSLSWLYGSGFPKSLDVSKAIDAAAGAERENVGLSAYAADRSPRAMNPGGGKRDAIDTRMITAPSTDLAKQWQGWGTALKPACEPICMARKPLRGTVAANVERYGTGAINVDACRIEGEVTERGGCREQTRGYVGIKGTTMIPALPPSDLGRWPANVLLDEEAAAMLDEQSGDVRSAGEYNGTNTQPRSGFVSGNTAAGFGYGDSGGASRFYYVAKPSREERDYGCEGLRQRSGGEATDRTDGSAGVNSPRAGAGRTGGSRNVHPTVKPVELMRWLIKLVTPLDGLVLDPFTGSGTTGMACRYESRRFIGIERDAEYHQIAEARIAAVAPLFGEEVG